MELKAIKLPASQSFAASRRAVRQTFGDVDELSAWFGYMTRTFTFDSRLRHRPRIAGTVIASLSVSRDRSAHLRLYPIARALYSDDAAAQFSAEMLPRLKSWLRQQLAKPETAILGVEEIVVEWVRGNHRIHEVRFL
ncbi:MAG TPA: hypothetical protein VEO74_09425 [Thermoanaerobaculia bacterium]|nr:hypothetical protein [Thermoanaerobaculia bacterium]